MNESEHGAATRARPKKSNGMGHVIIGVAPAPGPGPGPTPTPVPVSTILVGFPTPAPVTCLSPFQAMGTAAPTTQMAATALIYTPNGVLVGNLDANPPPPFTWSYTFTTALPQGVPLSLVVSGTTGTGAPDQAVVPFQCQ